MTILVPEINLFNLPLYYLLSFFCKVRVCETKTFFHRFKRIKLLNMSDYFNWEDCVIIGSEAVRIWEEISKSMPASRWKIKIAKRKLDMNPKAKQDLQKEIEKLLFLKKILDSRQNQRIYIISSLKFIYLSNMKKDEEIFNYPTIKVFSVLNVLLDRINLMLVNLFYAAYVIYQFITGLIRNNAVKANIKYIYDCINPEELSVDSDKLNFSWLVDDRVIHKDEFLFLIPDAGFEKKTLAKYNDLFVVNLSQMNKFALRKMLFIFLFNAFGNFFKNFLFALNFENLIKRKYETSILKWMPIIKSFSPKIYITCITSIGCERPVIIYLNDIGIKTVLWSYSATSYFFTTQQMPKEFDYRMIRNSNIISENFIVWNQDYKTFIESHPQYKVKIRTIGPLISANESVMRLSKSALRRKLGINDDAKIKVITAFDAPPPSSRYKFNALRPVYNTDEYNFTFLKDVYRLLSEFEDIVLVYKPKRSFENQKISYSSKSRILFDEMDKNPRVIIANFNINPWILIGAGDLCISISFVSTSLAALHYDKPAIFHDPLNIVRFTKYKKIDGLITHSFEQLKGRLELILHTENGFRDLKDATDMSDFIGINPGTDSSIKFREYLTTRR